LIVYISDNGFRQGPHDTFEPDTLDKAKDSMSELGFRTPLIFNWPGHLPAGVVRPDLVSSLDLFPTLLDFAGVPIPGDRPGIDLRPALEQGTAVPRTEIIGSVQRVRPVSVDGTPRRTVRQAYFVRSPKWHYAWYPEQGTEQLFDVQSDPREQRDLARARPRETAELKALVERWKAEATPSGG
jgi:arylsulfatase A-like enzyme